MSLPTTGLTQAKPAGLVRGLKTLALTTVGSTGDVVPYLALARALAARGHRVEVCSHAFHRELFERDGFAFHAIGAAFGIADFNRLMDEAAEQGAPIKQFDVLVRRLFLREPQKQLDDLAAPLSRAHAVICQRFDYLGQEAAIRRGVPWASVTLAPQLIATQEAPVYPAPDLGKWWTTMTWIALESMAEPTNRHVSAVLASVGSKPRALDVAGASSPHLDLVAASPSLVPKRGDWPRAARLTGAWFLDGASAFTPDPTLASFLERHRNPLVITFGSMGGTAGRATAELVLDTLRRLRRPAIVQHGYAGLLASSALPRDVLAIGHVPHDWLFPRAGCVVHHAGAGTAHAVARAGVPSAPLPHLFDQYYWAGRLHEVGVAPEVLFRHQATARKLSRHVEDALALSAPARALGAKISAEKGLDQAVQAIEALMAGAAPP